MRAKDLGFRPDGIDESDHQYSDNESKVNMKTDSTDVALFVRTSDEEIQKWDKRRILEVYLNTVDWGTGVMGAEAASMAYFQKHSDKLTTRQSALLAAILPNPHRLSPVKPNNYVRLRAKRILADMNLMPLL